MGINLIIKQNLIQPTSESLKDAFQMDTFCYEHPEGDP